MYLLDTSTLELHLFSGSGTPPYAILSHTWGSQEVSFQAIKEKRFDSQQTDGLAKVKSCCQYAKTDGFDYVWIDSCCIDKSSSAELYEAINSMYQWYQRANMCYTYMADVQGRDFSSEEFAQSRWFRRGWTLQELIAPQKMCFFNKHWQMIGCKHSNPAGSAVTDRFFQSFNKRLAQITKIDEAVLCNTRTPYQISIAQRMAWASERATTREEDMAYSLMGLFGVYMPIIYGEGLKNAFKRLQLEIIQKSTDQSIFAWRASRESSGLLAESPCDFRNSAAIAGWTGQQSDAFLAAIRPYSMTNLGLLITLRMPQAGAKKGYPRGEPEIVPVRLRCWTIKNGSLVRARIYLKRIVGPDKWGNGIHVYRRVYCDQMQWVALDEDFGDRKEIYVVEDDQYEYLKQVQGNRPIMERPSWASYGMSV